MATVAGSLRNKVLVVDDLTSGDITVTDLVVSGTVTLQGTATTLNSTNTTITDSIIELNSGLSGSNTKDIGFVFERGSTGNNAAFIWDESADRFTVITTTGTAADNTLTGTVADFQAGSFYGNGANLTSLNGSNISSGTVAAARIAGLPGNKITSGFIDPARIATGTAGDWWAGNVAKVGTDGVMEVGKYIDFHNADAGTSDYTARITNSGDHLYASGRLYVNGNQRVFADDYHPNADKWTTARSHTVALTGEVTGTATQSVDGTGNKTWSIATSMNNSSLDDNYVQILPRHNADGDSLVVQSRASITIWDVSGASDDPSGASDGLVLSAGWDSSSWGIQQFHDFHSNDLYLRAKNNGSMTSWDRVFHDTYHPNADKWTSSRTLTLSGEMTGSVSFDGSGAINMTNTVLSHGAYYLGQTTVETGRTAKESGFYSYNVMNNNLGTGTDTAYYSVMAWGAGTGGSAQIASKWTSPWDKLYFRSLRDTTNNWSDWREIYHTSHKPTYSELGTMAYSNLTGTPTIPTNNNQLTNGAGYITDGNTNWNNSYGFITSSDSSITSKLPKSGGTMTGELVISGTSPQMKFNDTDGDDFWLHVNSDRFYILPDRDDSGGWETPYALELNASTNIGYVFNQRIFNEAYHPNADKWTTARTLTLGGDASGAVSWDGSGNVTLSVAVVNDSHTHDGRYFTESESDARFTSKNHFSHTGTGNYTSTTTAALLTEALGDNAFDSYLTAHKTSWSYSGNGNLTDAGRLTELAGSSWLWWTDNSADNTQGNITGLAIAPTTGGSAGKMFVYNNQGASYAPGWREIWTSTSDGSGSGLDADLLDGSDGAHYLAWANVTGKPTIPTNNNQLTNGAGYTTNPGFARYNASTTYGAGNLQRFTSATNMATASGTQSSLECFSSGSGNDAFMTFHVGGDYAVYLGLDGGTNKLSTGGWSDGAVSHEIYHAGNKPSLATLGYTGATNANYITNNNQLTNGAGYTSNTGDITGVTAGTGLTGGGSSGGVTLNVIGGSGITANANDITVDSTVIRTTGAQSMSGVKTHTSRLALSSGQMLSLGDTNHHLVKVSTGYSGSTVDGPRLQGHQGGELTTNINSNQYSLRWDSAGNIHVRGDGKFNGTKIEGDGKEIVRFNDGWLRLNPDVDFTSGIYCGTGKLRTDGQFEVGSSGSAFKVTTAGNVTAAGTLGVGGNITVPTNTGLLTSGTETKFTTTHGYIQLGPMNSSYAHIYTGTTGGFYFNQTALYALGNTMWHAGNDGSGSGLDADTLDSIQSSSFLRSDANDTATGIVTFNNDTVHSQIRFTGVGGNSNVSNDSYAIYQEAGGWSHPYPDLVIGYHTGIKIGGHSSYGGTRFYNNNPTSGSIIASIGNGDNHFRGYHEGYLRHGGSTDNKIWTAGNDGSGSGLDADTLDSTQKSEFLYDLGTGTGDFRHNAGGSAGNLQLGQVPTTNVGSAYIVIQKQTNAGQPGSILYYVSPTGTTNGSSYLKFKMESDGDFHADGNVIAYSTTTGSDRKLKKNIRDLEGSLDKTLKLRGVKYDWKDENKDNNQLGFIAQEVEEVLPEVVKEVETLGEDSTHLTVNYPAVVPLLVEAIKEQQTLINRLEERIKDLENKQEK